MSDAPAVLIAAASARALAASARRAGYAPLVVDFFADEDTIGAAKACVQLQDGGRVGFTQDALLSACAHLAGGAPIAGFVYGSGFEDRPELLAAVGRRWRLIGNSPEVVRRVKDPFAFAALCRDSAIAHPRTTTEPPDDLANWLARQRGGAGGGHIRPAAQADDADARTYYQERVGGRPVSALFAANGAEIRLYGFSEQWASPAPGRPFRYGGAAGPAQLPRTMARTLTQALTRLVSRLPLVGLNSADFLVSEGQFCLLEINPRPGATLDIFEPEAGSGQSLFARHVAACAGALSPPPFDQGARAAALVHAERDIARTPRVQWPEWARDRQSAGSRVGAGEPFCTVVADGKTAADARRLALQRSGAILSALCARAA